MFRRNIPEWKRLFWYVSYQCKHGLALDTALEGMGYKYVGFEMEEKKMPKEVVNMAEDIRDYNIGESDYSKHKIQPWDIWIEYKLNPFDADIVKRVLRHKKTDSRKMDYEKIIHICKERIRQIDSGEDKWEE